MSSKLRPETCAAEPGTYTPRNGLAYLVIHNAVKDMDGLIHGLLGLLCVPGGW